MATDTMEFKLVMRPAKMNFAVADAHRDNRKRFVVHAAEKLSAFVELKRRFGVEGLYLTSWHNFRQTARL